MILTANISSQTAIHQTSEHGVTSTELRTLQAASVKNMTCLSFKSN